MKPKRVLVVLPEVHFAHQSRSPGFAFFFRFWCGVLKRRALTRSGRAGATAEFLYPEAFNGSFAPNAPDAVSWRLTWGLGTTRYEDLAEVCSFHADALKILDESELAEGGEHGLAQALRFALMTPQAEVLPFYITGLATHFRRFDEIWVFDGTEWHARLALAVANTLGLPAVVLPAPSLRIWERLYSIGRACAQAWRELRTPPLRVTPPKPISAPAALVIIGKGTSYRHVQPVLKFLGDVRHAVYCGLRISPFDAVEAGALSDGMTKAEFGRRYRDARQQCGKIWTRAQPRLRELAHTYKGVSIVDFYLGEMRDIWAQRGPAALMMIPEVRALLDQARPSVVMLTDPVEVSQLVAREAQRRNIPVLYYYNVNDGLTSTRFIYEPNFLDFSDHVLTVTSWQKEGIEALGSFQKKISVVGNSMQDIAVMVDRAKFHERLEREHGLRPDRPILIALTRPVSIALSWEEKKWILTSAWKACQRGGMQMVVKAHPHETRAQILQEFGRCGIDCPFFINEYLLEELLAVSAMALSTPGSSVNLYAIYAGLPLVIAASRSNFDLYDTGDGRDALRRNNAAFCVEYPGDLAAEILRVASDQRAVEEWRARARAYAEKVGGPFDGLASRRVATAFREMAE